MKKDFANLSGLRMVEVVKELRGKNPFLFTSLLASMLPASQDLSLSHMKRIIPRMAMIYGIAMQTNFAELSLIQSVVSMLLEKASCEQNVCIIYLKLLKNCNDQLVF